MASAGSLEFDITPHDIYNVTPALDFLCYVITAQYKPSTFCLFDTKLGFLYFFNSISKFSKNMKIFLFR